MVLTDDGWHDLSKDLGSTGPIGPDDRLAMGQGTGKALPQEKYGPGSRTVAESQQELERIGEMLRETRGGLKRAVLYNDLASGAFREFDTGGQRNMLAAMDGYSTALQMGDPALAVSREAMSADVAMRTAVDWAKQAGTIPERAWYSSLQRQGLDASQALLGAAAIARLRPQSGAARVSPNERLRVVPDTSARSPELVDVGPQGQHGARFYVRPDGEVLDAKTFDRAKFRSGVKDQTWGDAIDSVTGRVTDPYSGVEMNKQQPWEMGHRPQMEYWKERQHAIGQWLYKGKSTSREEFINRMNDPNRYRPELPASNRSHKAEDRSNWFRR